MSEPREAHVQRFQCTQGVCLYLVPEDSSLKRNSVPVNQHQSASSLSGPAFSGCPRSAQPRESSASGAYHRHCEPVPYGAWHPYTEHQLFWAPCHRHTITLVEPPREATTGLHWLGRVKQCRHLGRRGAHAHPSTAPRCRLLQSAGWSLSLAPLPSTCACLTPSSTCCLHTASPIPWVPHWSLANCSLSP